MEVHSVSNGREWKSGSGHRRGHSIDAVDAGWTALDGLPGVMLGLLPLLVRQDRFSLHKEGRRGSRGYVLSVCSPICVVTGFESIRDCLLRSLLLLFVFSGIWKRRIIMSGCGNANCKCGAGCTCKDGCSCGMSMAVPSFGGLRNYNEPDCKCGPDCKCADCDCHKGK